MAAPLGNQHARNKGVWKAAIERVLATRKGRVARKKVLDELAEKLIDQCYEGDLAALRELGDRLDGKPKQIIAGSDEDPPIRLEQVRRVIVDAKSGSADSESLHPAP